MKKTLLLFLAILLNCSIRAQDEPALLKDFYKRILGVKSLVFDEHTNIMQVNTGDDHFDILAINEQMQVIWKTSFEGFAIATEKFKGKIVAIAATEYSTFKGTNNTYKAYLIDPANGKSLVEKIIYNDNDDYTEYPSVFTGEGSFFKFCVRRSGLSRSLHVGLPGIFALGSIAKYGREFNDSEELDVISFNDDLQSKSKLKLPIANGTMINWCCNKRGDLFIAWLNGPSVETYRFPDGSDKPAMQLNADVTFQLNDNIIPSEHMQLLASVTDNNVLYYGVTYKNQDKNIEVGLGKFDFATGKKTYITESFSKEHVKTLQKSFVPVNKKIDDPDLGNHNGLHLRYLAESSGNLIATITAKDVQTSSYGAWMAENSVLINVYDNNLNIKVQQILPASYSYPNTYLPIGYYLNHDKFYIVSNAKSGMNTFTPVYGCLDIATGKWDKMVLLSKKKIDNSDFCMGNTIFWFPDYYIVPYFSLRNAVMSQSKFDITALQLNKH